MSRKNGHSAQVASAATAVEEAEGRVMELQGEVQQVLQQLSKAAADAHASSASTDAAKRSLAEQQRESGELKAAVERQRKAAAEAREKTEEATAELEREKGKRKRLEEDQVSLRSKVERMHHAAASGSGSSDLMEELQMYKELLKCQVRVRVEPLLEHIHLLAPFGSRVDLKHVLKHVSLGGLSRAAPY